VFLPNKGRCCFFIFIDFFRIPQLDAKFEKLLQKERNGPTPLPYMKDVYSEFLQSTYDGAHNVVCSSCGTIGHDLASYHTLHVDDVLLRVLSVPQDTYVPFDFSTGYADLDNHRIMIDKLSLSQTGDVYVCASCHRYIAANKRPIEAISNYRWFGEQPGELRDLTWLEELLIARAHLVGRIVRLEKRTVSSYFSLKGHTVLLPQDTTRLLDLLPMPLSSLPEIVRVVWAGRLSPERVQLRQHFTVRTSKVYHALLWLCRNHEDYRHVRIDEERLAVWNSTEVGVELMDSMTTVEDPSTEDSSRSGFATEDPDTEEVDGDIPQTVSGFVDINNITRSPDISTLYRAAQLRDELTSPIIKKATINVVTGNTIINEYSDPTYFTSAFPTLFPYGTGKHLDNRRPKELSLASWIKLLLRHSSRYSST